MKYSGHLFSALLVWLASTASGRAHPSLYHQIELNLRDPVTARLYLTVHVPELPSAIAAGVDPVAVDAEWLRGRSDEELTILIGEGESLVKDLFTFGLSHGFGEVAVDPLPLPLEWETPDQVRDPAYDNGLPEGCLLASASFPNPGAPQDLVVQYAPRADKRLMLLIARPAAFPEVRDLAPGESVRIVLPEIPSQGGGKTWGWVVLLAGFALGIGILVKIDGFRYFCKDRKR